MYRNGKDERTYADLKIATAKIYSNVRKKIENISITFSIFLKKNIFTLHKPFNVSHHIPVKMISDQKGIFAVLKIELLIMDDNFKKNKNIPTILCGYFWVDRKDEKGR